MWANYRLCLAVWNPEISLLWQGWAITNSLQLQTVASPVLLLTNFNSVWQFGFESVCYGATLTLMSRYADILSITEWRFPDYNPTFPKVTWFQRFPFWGSMSQFTDGWIQSGDVDLKSCSGISGPSTCVWTNHGLPASGDSSHHHWDMKSLPILILNSFSWWQIMEVWHGVQDLFFGMPKSILKP